MTNNYYANQDVVTKVNQFFTWRKVETSDKPVAQLHALRPLNAASTHYCEPDMAT